LLYSVKLIFFTFFNNYNGFFLSLFSISFSSFYMLFPLFILFYLSIFSGFFSFDLFLGSGTDFWGYSLYVSSFDWENLIFFHSFLNWSFFSSYFFLFSYEFFKYVEFIPFIWIFYFTFLFFFIFSLKRFYLFDLKWSSFWLFNLFNFFVQKWIFYYKLCIYNLIDLFYFFGKFCYFFIEKGFLERYGPFGISLSIQWLMKKYHIFLKGLVYHYLGFILLGVFLGFHFLIL
jgi:NADH-ubiquinone oxidoreductase chain 5